MRALYLWCTGLLLFSVVIIAGAENSSASAERKARYQRKVLVRRSSMTSRAASTTQLTQNPISPQQSSSSPTKPVRPTFETAIGSEKARPAGNVAETTREQLVRLVSGYIKEAQAIDKISSSPDWLGNPIKVEIPNYGESGGRERSSTIPVFLLPYFQRQECSANRDNPERYYLNQDESRRTFSPHDETQRPPYEEPRKPIWYDERRPDYYKSRRPSYESHNSKYYEPSSRPYYSEPYRPTYPDSDRPTYYEHDRPTNYEHRRPIYHGTEHSTHYERQRPTTHKPDRPTTEKPDLSSSKEPRPHQSSNPITYFRGSMVTYPTLKIGFTAVESDRLVEEFRAQKPKSPDLPAIVIRHKGYSELRPSIPPTQLHPAPPSGQPKKPRFDRPLAVRGSLKVYRADYTEDYIAWWDPVTGDSRVDFADGATNTYRTLQDGRVHRIAMSYDRTSDWDERRCFVMRDLMATEADYAPPMLPDIEPFTFSGYYQVDGTQAELWVHTVTGKNSTREETLTYRHEMLLARYNNTAKPIKYSVTVDSSVLDKKCDYYEHSYHDVQMHQPDPSLFHYNVATQCTSVQDTVDMTVVEPLREFTLMERNPGYDALFTQFKKDLKRSYIDFREEAVRKNLLMQTKRYVDAGNRVGATFVMEVNYLADRLDAELELLLGVTPDHDNTPAESFPYKISKINSLAESLPKSFDWRQRGAVSRVRSQGQHCQSCWAIAVTGAIEGALFRKTRLLVPLSEQSIVDCSQPYGGNGCNPTWPGHAYDYAKDRGLPAREEYIPYQAHVVECKDKIVKPVTLISAHVNVTTNSVPALQLAIRRHAPTVVVIDLPRKNFFYIKHGVYDDKNCFLSNSKNKHAVLAVGWGEHRGETHFIIKNSWSAAWGHDGYARMHGPSNMCGMLAYPTYPRLEADDVLRDLDPIAVMTDDEVPVNY